MSVRGEAANISKVSEYICFLGGKTLLLGKEKTVSKEERECITFCEHSLVCYCLISTSSFMSISSPLGS